MIDPLLGTEVARYRIVRLLGEGGMGRVYLAVHPEIGSRVAIKVLSAESVGNAHLVQRFFDEARAVNLIAHDHIVSILDLDRLPDGRPYIVMEYVPGNTLRALIEQGPLPVAGLVRVGTEVLQALDAVHAAGIVHRDLKPDNVMITLSGHVKVLDFGIAKLTRDRSSDTPRTRTGAMIGTPDYMAPEQIRGWEVDARTDLYAVGLLLYEAATGARPFTGDSDFDVMDKHLREEPRDPRVLRPELPSPLAAVILAALNKTPTHRFQSARAMGNALSAITPGTLDTWNALSSRAWRADDVPAEVDLRQAATLASTGTAHARRDGEGTAQPEARAPQGVLRYVLVAALVASACAITFAVARRTEDRAAPYEPPSPPAMATTPRDAAPPADAPVDHARLGMERLIASLPTIPPKLDPLTFKTTLYAKDYDSTRLDPYAYLPRAAEHARVMFPDAQLRATNWINLTADGFIDFSDQRGGAVYYFQSEAGRLAGPVKQPCAVALSLGAIGLSISVDDRCDGSLLEVRCSGAEIHARLQAAGMPRELPIVVGAFGSPRTSTPGFQINVERWNRDDVPVVPNDCR